MKRDQRRFCDPGSGFDADAVPNPLNAENLLKASGRSVYSINELMDEVAFTDGGRQVQMCKRRDGKPAAPKFIALSEAED